MLTFLLWLLQKCTWLHELLCSAQSCSRTNCCFQVVLQTCLCGSVLVCRCLLGYVGLEGALVLWALFELCDKQTISDVCWAWVKWWLDLLPVPKWRLLASCTLVFLPFPLSSNTDVYFLAWMCIEFQEISLPDRKLSHTMVLSFVDALLGWNACLPWCSKGTVEAVRLFAEDKGLTHVCLASFSMILADTGTVFAA